MQSLADLCQSNEFVRDICQLWSVLDPSAPLHRDFLYEDLFEILKSLNWSLKTKETFDDGITVLLGADLLSSDEDAETIKWTDPTTLSGIKDTLFPTADDEKVARVNALQFLAKSMPEHYAYHTNWEFIKILRPHCAHFVNTVAVSEFNKDSESADSNTWLELLLKVSFHEGHMCNFDMAFDLLAKADAIIKQMGESVPIRQRAHYFDVIGSINGDVMENFDEAIESFQKALDLKVMPDGQTNPTFTYPEECWTRASLLQRLPVSQGKIHQEKLATIFQQVLELQSTSPDDPVPEDLLFSFVVLVQEGVEDPFMMDRVIEMYSSTVGPDSWVVQLFQLENLRSQEPTPKNTKKAKAAVDIITKELGETNYYTAIAQQMYACLLVSTSKTKAFNLLKVGRAKALERYGEGPISCHYAFGLFLLNVLTDNVKGGLAALDEAEQSIKKAFPGNSPLLARFLKNKLGDLPECVEDAEDILPVITQLKDVAFAVWSDKPSSPTFLSICEVLVSIGAAVGDLDTAVEVLTHTVEHTNKGEYAFVMSRIQLAELLMEAEQAELALSYLTEAQAELSAQNDTKSQEFIFSLTLLAKAQSIAGIDDLGLAASQKAVEAARANLPSEEVASHQFAAAAVFAQAGKFGDARNLAKDCIERLEASEEADPEEIEQIKEFLDSLSKKDAPKAGQKERSKGKKSKSAAQSPLLPVAIAAGVGVVIAGVIGAFMWTRRTRNM